MSKCFNQLIKVQKAGFNAHGAELRETRMRADSEVRCKQLNMTRRFSNICQLFTMKRIKQQTLIFWGIKDLTTGLFEFLKLMPRY